MLYFLHGVKYVSLFINSDTQAGWIDEAKAYSILIEQSLHFIECGPFLGECGTEILKDPDGMPLV